MEMTEETIAKIRQAEQEADRMEQEAEAKVVLIEKETEQTVASLYAEAKKKNAEYAEKCLADADAKAKEQEAILLKEAEESFSDIEKVGKGKLSEVAAAIYARLIQ